MKRCILCDVEVDEATERVDFVDDDDGETVLKTIFVCSKHTNEVAMKIHKASKGYDSEEDIINDIENIIKNEEMTI